MNDYTHLNKTFEHIKKYYAIPCMFINFEWGARAQAQQSSLHQACQIYLIRPPRPPHPPPLPKMPGIRSLNNKVIPSTPAKAISKMRHVDRTNDEASKWASFSEAEQKAIRKKW